MTRATEEADRLLQLMTAEGEFNLDLDDLSERRQRLEDLVEVVVFLAVDQTQLHDFSLGDYDDEENWGDTFLYDHDDVLHEEDTIVKLDREMDEAVLRYGGPEALQRFLAADLFVRPSGTDERHVWNGAPSELASFYVWDCMDLGYGPLALFGDPDDYHDLAAFEEAKECCKAWNADGLNCDEFDWSSNYTGKCIDDYVADFLCITKSAKQALQDNGWESDDVVETATQILDSGVARYTSELLTIRGVSGFGVRFADGSVIGMRRSAEWPRDNHCYTTVIRRVAAAMAPDAQTASVLADLLASPDKYDRERGVALAAAPAGLETESVAPAPS